MPVLKAALLMFGVGLLAASACAVPKPPPKFWSSARCERVMLTQHPAVTNVLCVGTGGSAACRWTSGRARLFSEFRVFARLRQRYVYRTRTVEPGVVRAFTLATRSRPGFAPIVHHYGDSYVGWPADFFIARIRVLAIHVDSADFDSLVAPIAARLIQRNETTTCAGLSLRQA
jgi:hypothetical protein